MNRLLLALVFGASLTSFTGAAQISGVTRRKITQPMPTFSLWNTNAARSNLTYVSVGPAVDPAQKEAAQRRALESQKKRAEEGSSGAQYDLGMRFLNGDGVEKDSDLARKWLGKSAEQGNPAAQRKLDELAKSETTPKTAP